MSQTVITTAFERWKAAQAVSGEAVTLDEFVFANVPDLDTDAPIDRNEVLPDAVQIVHRQAVSRTGVVNENAVVYSVVLGAETGDFAFNWIGLVNRNSGTLAMIVHAPLQQKIKTTAGQQGNVLTRSFLMEFNGAQTETAIDTPAETWQIDFTARMAGMDERQRLENIDIYGAGAFFGNGWLVGKTGSQYFVTSGSGYVAGLRAELAENQNITVTTRPVKVWLDVSWRGTLTSAWAVEPKITVAASLSDYEIDGIPHYVFALASIDADGNITDLRPRGTLSEQQARNVYLRQDRNLGDLPDVERARENLQLGKLALLDNIGFADVGAVPARGSLNDMNLNDITGSKYGFWYQSTIVNATPELNYPVASAGALLVFQNGANGPDGCTQEFRPYMSNVVYRRYYNKTASTDFAWSSWGYDISNVGGTINGAVGIIKNGAPLLIRSETQNQAVYILGQDYDKSNLYYIGRGGATFDVSFVSYKGGNHILLAADGAVKIYPSNGRDVLSSTRFVPTDYSNFDSLYQSKKTAVTAVRLGAAKDVSNGNGNLTDQSGYVLTMGGDFGANDGSYRMRPLQYLINGTWHNAVSA
ncbi:phage tail protein [Mixta intestinalis]|uniref:Uncharacterized protein n=1 Tax=Mixta intestinalis TaxID=1615494 RepID=A0A6P1Q1V1_9GAMM|nr:MULTISPECIES: phage tail protein [Mixta]QHM72950.1 hypothetical protein C7M51_03291 [Mixta intestinalis]QHM77703.1 hypothetical protein C7M52_03706 [Mixta theicola]